MHLKERMHALEEKNALTQELDKTRKIAEDLQNEKSEIMKELGKTRLEIDNVKRQMLQQEIAFNIQQTDALTRSLSPNAIDPTSSRSASHSSFDAHSLPRRSGKRIIDDDQTKSYVARTLAEQEWEKLQQAHVLANVQQAFDVSSDAEGDGDNESIFSSAADVISPTGHTDAQTLAMMLQEQLDAINIEIRLIQEEKQSTEARAEELESRVGSLEHMNLLTRGRSLERTSPPLSGRSTPKSHHSPSRDYLHKYHTVKKSFFSFLFFIYNFQIIFMLSSHLLLPSIISFFYLKLYRERKFDRNKFNFWTNRFVLKEINLLKKNILQIGISKTVFPGTCLNVTCPSSSVCSVIGKSRTTVRISACEPGSFVCFFLFIFFEKRIRNQNSFIYTVY